MKKLLLFGLLYYICIGLSAQGIQGTVLDKDNGKPISDVIVQYGDQSGNYVYTDKKGKFIIPQGSRDMIYFQCFGYITKSVAKSSLIEDAKVYLEINPVSLKAVVISPDDADALLEEVMINTKKNLVTEQPLGYLLHFLQTRSVDTTRNEIYLKYTTTLKEKALKKDLKKERVPYIYNIVDIKSIERTETPASELFGAEYHASHLFSFGKSENNETTKSYTSDSTLMILKISPLPGREGWARGEVLINKEDMTIVSMKVESVDSIMEAQPSKRYLDNKVKILRKEGRFEFQKVKDKYYMKNCFSFYKFHIENQYGRQEDIMYECDVNFIGSGKNFHVAARKLSGFYQGLFYFPDTTLKEFWLDYQDDEILYQIEREFDESFVTGDKDRGNKTVNFLKGAIIPVGLFGIFLLVL
ncbi:MAG: carboxypeptidase-like regulatory domain-containing protein [Prevotella sp.]|jgi:hypothetical protein|nr:carboxypeptidase-like regulatory domain-containing protein [Prevotella sp.]